MQKLVALVFNYSLNALLADEARSSGSFVLTCSTSRAALIRTLKRSTSWGARTRI